MLPIDRRAFNCLRFKEAAKSGYPASMSRGSKKIVNAGNKSIVLKFFSENFTAPRISNFQKDHQTICKRLGAILSINSNRKNKLVRETIAAKFLDTFLYQLIKFDDYRNLSKHLHLIVDRTIINKLKKKDIGDEKLKSFLKKYPSSPYEATYSSYKEFQTEIDLYIRRKKHPYIKKKIDLNLLWA